MVDGIKKAIDYIKSNDAYIKKAIELQCSVWRCEKTDMPPLALSCWLTEKQQSWLPWYNFKEIHFDGEKMFINGLREVLTAVNGNYGRVPSMRANMGCGIVPSLFGKQQTLFEDKMPWLLEHLKKEDIKNISEDYIFSINNSAEFAAAMEHMEYMTGILRGNKLTGKVFVYPLDLQGAIDTAHLVYGDSIFYDFYDDPDFMYHLLNLSNKLIYFAMNECFKRIDKSDEYITHYNSIIMPKSMGGIKVSEDTTTLLSPPLIDEFSEPYLRKILSHFNGGYVHYCGKNDHLLNMLLNEPLVRGINFGNPEKHDMTKILEKCRDSKKIYYGSVNKKDGEDLFDYFVRVLEPSYDRNAGYFYIILEYGCGLSERENVIGEFERAAEYVIKNCEQTGA
ncbi:MAG: hypothetical protein FWD71_04955 [Oscillospiraceae bacterium]|nr:hypothetical protein [Oscillospiraceae bacterium]